MWEPGIGRQPTRALLAVGGLVLLVMLVTWGFTAFEDDQAPGVRARRAHARVGSDERTHAPGLVAAGQSAYRAAREAERGGDAAAAAVHYLEAAENYERALAVTRGAGARRALSLPAGRSLGSIATRPDPASPWRDAGEAVGTVAVPAGGEVRLAVAPDFADADLDVLLAWPPGTLQSLDLGRSRVTDAGLEKVARLEGLNDLSLLGLSVGDAGLIHLARLPSLKYLNLGQTQATDASLPVLEALPVLESLNVQGTGFTEALVPVAASREALRILLLDADQISDRTVPLLTGLRALEWLSLGGDDLTDSSVEHLAQMTWLTSLQLTASGISDEGIRRLRRELKDCQVRD
jgi:hypothetical protein